MPQALIYLEKKEDDVVKHFSEKWNLSKAETIKKIIMEFKVKGDEKNAV